MSRRHVMITAFALITGACANEPSQVDTGSGYDPSAGSPSDAGKDGGGVKSGGNGNGNGNGGGQGGPVDSGVPPISNDCDASDPTCGTSALDGGAPSGEAGACANGQAGLLGAIPGATMAPGTACVSCHVSTNAKALGIGGTVYQSPHEADECIGVSQNIKVVITDSAGQTHDLAVNSSGNFSDMSVIAISSPYTAAVVGPGGSRPMIAKITNGDCNSCHTAAGASNAPGRIMAP